MSEMAGMTADELRKRLCGRKCDGCGASFEPMDSDVYAGSITHRPGCCAAGLPGDIHDGDLGASFRLVVSCGPIAYSGKDLGVTKLPECDNDEGDVVL